MHKIKLKWLKQITRLPFDVSQIFYIDLCCVNDSFNSRLFHSIHDIFDITTSSSSNLYSEWIINHKSFNNIREFFRYERLFIYYYRRAKMIRRLRNRLGFRIHVMKWFIFTLWVYIYRPRLLWKRRWFIYNWFSIKYYILHYFYLSDLCYYRISQSSTTFAFRKTLFSYLGYWHHYAPYYFYMKLYNRLFMESDNNKFYYHLVIIYNYICFITNTIIDILKNILIIYSKIIDSLISIFTNDFNLTNWSNKFYLSAIYDLIETYSSLETIISIHNEKIMASKKDTISNSFRTILPIDYELESILQLNPELESILQSNSNISSSLPEGEKDDDILEFDGSLMPFEWNYLKLNCILLKHYYSYRLSMWLDDKVYNLFWNLYKIFILILSIINSSKDALFLNYDISPFRLFNYYNSNFYGKTYFFKRDKFHKRILFLDFKYYTLAQLQLFFNNWYLTLLFNNVGYNNPYSMKINDLVETYNSTDSARIKNYSDLEWRPDVELSSMDFIQDSFLQYFYNINSDLNDSIVDEYEYFHIHTLNIFLFYSD